MKKNGAVPSETSTTKLWILFGINSLLFMFSTYMFFTLRLDKWIAAFAAIVTGLAAFGCWFQIRQLRPGEEEDPGPLGEP